MTGGAGAVGSHLVDALLEAGAAEVRVLDRLGPPAPNGSAPRPRLRWITGDVREPAVVGEATRGADLVFHQAALPVGRCAEDPALARDVMAEGTRTVVEAAARAGARRLIFASSAVLYGPDPVGDVDERSAADRADTLYGELKADGEQLLRGYQGTDLACVSLRYFNVYGPRMRTAGPHTEVLVRWLRRIDDGLPPIVDGDGTQTIDLVHVHDVARANLLAAACEVAPPAVNVGTGRGTTMNELATRLLLASGSDLIPRHGPSRPTNAAPRRVADTSLAAEALGFRARVALDEGLDSVVAWWRGESRDP